MNEKKEKGKSEAVDLNRFFDSDKVFDASEKKLNQVLKQLCSENIPNEIARHKAINRCTLVNTVKNFRFMDRIATSNKRLTGIVIFLMIVTILSSGVLIWLSIKSSRQFNKLVDIEKQQLEIVKSIHKD